MLLALTLTAQQSAPPGAVPVSIIVVASQLEADRVREQLVRGAAFADVAKELSTDPSAPDGGYLGMVDPGNLRAELRNAMASLQPGGLSGIVRIPAGYALLKISSAPPGGPPVAAAPTKLQSVSSAGAVRLTYDYSGFASALRAVDKYEKPAGWDRNLQVACEVRTAAVPAIAAQLEPMLARPGAPPAFVRDVNALMADLSAYSGDFSKAERHWQASREVSSTASPERVPQFLESLGVAHLQRAGLTLYKDFVFPHALAGFRTPGEKADLAAAIDYFQQYLKRVPEDGEVRWLLNLAHMLSGSYSAGVPREFLIPSALLAGNESPVHFSNKTLAAGLERIGQAGGAIIEDFDNDGLLDILASNVNDCEPLALFHNNGDGTFTNRSAQAGLLGQTGGLNILQTDYNNDGCKDVLVLRGGWEYGRRKSLLRNNCDGTFTDVTDASGLGQLVTATQTAVWTDIDNDGWLDLFVGNENAPAQLFLNKRDGTFAEIGAAAGVGRVGFTKGVVAADYDNDGFPDLYVSALNGEHHLYHNNRNRTFTDVTREAGVEGPWTTFGAMFFDYDNDGFDDLLIAGYGVSVEDVMKGYLGQPQGGEGLRLFHNLGNGKFRDVSAEMGLKRVFMPMGLNFGDIDNDGFPDFYLGSGNPSYASPIPNVMFHNEGGHGFQDVTASSGTGVLPKGHGIAFADLDNDGDEDLFVVMGGAVLGDKQSARLFENPGNGNGWLAIQLVGEKSNRAGVGARITVTVRNGGGPRREIHRTVGTGGSFGASPLRQHLGLGKSPVIESVEVLWPSSGIRQRFTGISANKALEIHEPENTARVLSLKPFRFGTTAPKTK